MNPLRLIGFPLDSNDGNCHERLEILLDYTSLKESQRNKAAL